MKKLFALLAMAGLLTFGASNTVFAQDETTTTEEVAATAQFLMSDSAISFSGQIFEMDCGIVSFKM